MLPFAFDEFDLIGVADSISWVLSIDGIVWIDADSHRQDGRFNTLVGSANILSRRKWAYDPKM
jgi:hypothetical protein